MLAEGKMGAALPVWGSRVEVNKYIEPVKAANVDCTVFRKTEYENFSGEDEEP